MLNKENLCPPKKQGILYTISTGKNNGVYLPKDISYQNHKSLKLLTKEAQESHKSYVDTLKLVEKQERESSKHSQNLIQVESFCQNYQFDLKHLSSLRNALSECSTLNKQVKAQMQKLQDNILTQNTNLYEAALPALKTLKQKIKQNKQEQSANYSKMHRELQKIEQSFGLVASGIKQCERKFQISEENYKGGRAGDQ